MIASTATSHVQQRFPPAMAGDGFPSGAPGYYQPPYTIDQGSRRPTYNGQPAYYPPANLPYNVPHNCHSGYYSHSVDPGRQPLYNYYQSYPKNALDHQFMPGVYSFFHNGLPPTQGATTYNARPPRAFHPPATGAFQQLGYLGPQYGPVSDSQYLGQNREPNRHRETRSWYPSNPGHPIHSHGNPIIDHGVSYYPAHPQSRNGPIIYTQVKGEPGSTVLPNLLVPTRN